MFFPDLHTTTEIDSGPHVRAIGWLDDLHEFPRGKLAKDVVLRIAAFANRSDESSDALHWPTAGGSHTCELCRRKKDSGELAVPAGDLLYVCPTMITHYIEAHEYAPPAEFVDAIMAAPLPGTKEYTRATKKFAEIGSNNSQRLAEEEWLQLQRERAQAIEDFFNWGNVKLPPP